MHRILILKRKRWRHERAHDRRLHARRTHGVHAQPRLCVLDRQGLGETHERGLRRAVGRAIGLADQARDRDGRAHQECGDDQHCSLALLDRHAKSLRCIFTLKHEVEVHCQADRDGTGIAHGVFCIRQHFAEQTRAVFKRPAIFIAAVIAIAGQEMRNRRKLMTGIDIHQVKPSTFRP